MFDNNKNRRHLTLAALLVLGSFHASAWADAYEDAAKKWIGSEFKPSTLTPEQQLEELKWFIKASEPFRGMKINVVSETIATHEYESKVLAKAFSEITGIKLTHDLLQEGDVVEKLQTQMQSDKNIYDGWVNDSDLIGTHFRYGKTESITDLMANEGKDYTSPTLDLKDFIGISFTTAPDGKVYQLPDQQFANLYWFRADWFDRPDLKAKFKEKYGYELGVPVNWSAYEDIAKFFSEDVKEIDGKRVYGHMDYGKKDPSLGWRFTDAWFSMAGGGDKGLPNGLPVGRMGDSRRGLPPGRLQCHPWRRYQRPGGGVCHAKICRLDARLCAARGPGHDLLRVRAGAVPGQYRPADLLVHSLYRRHDQAGPAGDERRRHAEVAHGAVAQGAVLGGGHEAGLSGRRLLDLPQVDPGEATPGGLAVRPVRHLQDRLAEKDHRRPDADPRV